MVALAVRFSESVYFGLYSSIVNWVASETASPVPTTKSAFHILFNDNACDHRTLGIILKHIRILLILIYVLVFTTTRR